LLTTNLLFMLQRVCWKKVNLIVLAVSLEMGALKPLVLLFKLNNVEFLLSNMLLTPEGVDCTTS